MVAVVIVNLHPFCRVFGALVGKRLPCGGVNEPPLLCLFPVSMVYSHPRSASGPMGDPTQFVPLAAVVPKATDLVYSQRA